MSCRNFEEKMYELRRCGCERCYREYRDMERRYRYDDRYDDRYDYRPVLFNPTTMLGLDVAKETPKVEEPKNIAIKVLVDKLKAEQASLKSNSETLKSYEAQAKTYRDNKNKNLKQIKELAAALKKLGHKEDMPNV